MNTAAITKALEIINAKIDAYNDAMDAGVKVDVAAGEKLLDDRRFLNEALIDASRPKFKACNITRELIAANAD